MSTPMRLSLISFAALALIGALFAGCQQPPEPAYDQPTVPRGYYDVVWVEPQIVYADSLYTIIRADRKDSVFVRTNEVNSKAWAPALEFSVRADTCFASITLHFLEGTRTDMPLMARYLRKGYYKLTMNDPLKFGEEFYRGSYILRGTVCGRKVTLPVKK